MHTIIEVIMIHMFAIRLILYGAEGITRIIKKCLAGKQHPVYFSLYPGF